MVHGMRFQPHTSEASPALETAWASICPRQQAIISRPRAATRPVMQEYRLLVHLVAVRNKGTRGPAVPRGQRKMSPEETPEDTSFCL